MKLTLKANALHNVVSDALQFASTDTTLPGISSVRLETVARADSVDLLAVATDRFTLGVSRADANGDTLPAFSLAASDAKNLVRMAKTTARMAGFRTVAIESDEYSQNVVFTFSSGETLTVHKHEHDFVSWRQLIPYTMDNRDVTHVSPLLATVDTLKVAQFSKVVAAKRNPARMFQTLPHKPVVVAIGNDFIGLLMPHREPNDVSYSNPAWL